MRLLTSPQPVKLRKRLRAKYRKNNSNPITESNPQSNLDIPESIEPVSVEQPTKSYNSYEYIPAILDPANCTHQEPIDSAIMNGGNKEGGGYLETASNWTNLPEVARWNEPENLALTLEILEDQNYEERAVKELGHPGVVIKGCLCGHRHETYRIVWCRDYCCPFCMKKKAGKDYREVLDLIRRRIAMTIETVVKYKDGRTRVIPPFLGLLKMITLTNLVVCGTLDRAIRISDRNWKRFRRSRMYKKYALGCEEKTELKKFDGMPNPKTKNPRMTEPGWLTHNHLIVECSYWDIDKIRKLWKRISGAEQVWISDIDLTDDDDDDADIEAEDWTKIALEDKGGIGGTRPKVKLTKAVLEATKYVMKPLEMVKMSYKDRREYQETMAGGKRPYTRTNIGQNQDKSMVVEINTGRKLSGTYGAWYGLPKTDPEEDGGDALKSFSKCPRCEMPRYPPKVMNYAPDLMYRLRQDGSIYTYADEDEHDPVFAAMPSEYHDPPRPTCRDCHSYPCGKWKDVDEITGKIKYVNTTELDDYACSDFDDKREIIEYAMLRPDDDNWTGLTTSMTKYNERCLNCNHPNLKRLIFGIVSCPDCGCYYNEIQECPTCGGQRIIGGEGVDISDCSHCHNIKTPNLWPKEGLQEAAAGLPRAQEGPPEALDKSCLALLPSDEAEEILRAKRRIKRRSQGQGRDTWAMDQWRNDG